MSEETVVQKDFFLNQLITELASTTADYRTSASGMVGSEYAVLFDLLARRNERFQLNIKREILDSEGSDKQKPVVDKPRMLLPDAKNWNRIFTYIEERESRLERLYREILRNSEIQAEVRRILESQFKIIRKYHNFVIAEDVNIVLSGEFKIPSEFYKL